MCEILSKCCFCSYLLLFKIAIKKTNFYLSFNKEKSYDILLNKLFITFNQEYCVKTTKYKLDLASYVKMFKIENNVFKGTLYINTICHCSIELKFKYQKCP